eukprot:GHVN01019217.1.p1 GENE.GHVN01019217.1~~GHVN01019217.1.p1  ORF type:complete len:139 (+),score=7.67 GHVN01019217.1:253-669(+)
MLILRWGESKGLRAFSSIPFFPHDCEPGAPLRLCLPLGGVLVVLDLVDHPALDKECVGDLLGAGALNGLTKRIELVKAPIWHDAVQQDWPVAPFGALATEIRAGDDFPSFHVGQHPMGDFTPRLAIIALHPQVVVVHS